MTCDDGDADLLTRSLSLTTLESTYLISVRSKSKYLSCTILVRGTTEDKFSFSAITPEINLVTNDTQQNIINPPNTADDLSTDGTYSNFLDWFNGLSGWQAAVKWIIVVIISIIVGTILLLITYKSVSIAVSCYRE